MIRSLSQHYTTNDEISRHSQRRTSAPCCHNRRARFSPHRYDRLCRIPFSENRLTAVQSGAVPHRSPAHGAYREQSLYHGRSQRPMLHRPEHRQLPDLWKTRILIFPFQYLKPSAVRNRQIKKAVRPVLRAFPKTEHRHFRYAEFRQ